MATGSISDSLNKPQSVRNRPQVGTLDPSKVGAFIPRRDHNPRELKSWAKRTGYVSDLSGETIPSSSNSNVAAAAAFDLERGVGGGGNRGGPPKIEIEEVEAVGGVRRSERDTMRVERRREDEPVLGRDNEERSSVEGRNGNRVVGGGPADDAKKMDEEGDGRREGVKLYEGNGREGMQVYEEGGEESGRGGWGRPSAMRVGLRENPGFG